jgi:hypothetical protein
MKVYSEKCHDDQNDGSILMAALKQHYIMFPAPITFINDEFKAELRMKAKKDEEVDDAKFFF